MTATRLLTPALLLLTAASAPAGTELKYRRDILRKPRSEAVTLAPLDAAVHAETRDGFPDVRVVDDLGREVPFAIRVNMEERDVEFRSPSPSRLASLNVTDSGALEVVVELEDDAPEPNVATVETPLRDFERGARVLGSRDGERWEPLAEGRIFDYSRFMDARDVDLAFPSRGFRRFKFVFEREADEVKSPYYQLTRDRVAGEKERRVETETILRRPFRIDHVALFRAERRAVGEKPVTVRSPLTPRSVEVDRRERVTRVEVDAGRLPLTRLSLRTTSRNFHRPARVQRPRGAGWVDVGSGALSLYELGDFRREELDLDFPEVRADRLRIVIEDGDNPPLEVAGVDGAAIDYRLAFVAEAGRSYRLEYGSDDVDAPRYDAEAVLEALGPGAAREVATLGPPVANPDYRPSPRPAVPARVWMFLAVVLMTLVLAWAVLQAVKRADAKAPDDLDLD